MRTATPRNFAVGHDAMFEAQCAKMLPALAVSQSLLDFLLLRVALAMAVKTWGITCRSTSVLSSFLGQGRAGASDHGAMNLHESSA